MRLGVARQRARRKLVVVRPKLVAGYAKIAERYKADAQKLARARNAYATLTDAGKRAAYLKTIGLTDERIKKERETAAACLNLLVYI